jgi:hypothetical protein
MDAIDRDEALEMIRPGLDCPRCGDEFNPRNPKAKGRDECVECAVQMFGPDVDVLPDADADRLGELAFERRTMLDYDICEGN